MGHPVVRKAALAAIAAQQSASTAEPAKASVLARVAGANVSSLCKRTPETRAKVLELLRRGHSRHSAAGGAGIAGRTLRLWVADESEFAAECDAAEAGGEAALYESALAGVADDPKHALKMLQCRFPERYAAQGRFELEATAAMAGDEANPKMALRLKLKAFLPEAESDDGDDVADE